MVSYLTLFANLGPTEAKLSLRVLPILLGLLEIELSSSGSLIKLIGLELFDLHATILFLFFPMFLVKYCCLFMRVNVQILFLYILYLNSTTRHISLIFYTKRFSQTFSDLWFGELFRFAISNCFHWCMLTSLLNLL